jgi:uncharacterized repeat protein (TIGR04138 family)
MKRVDFHNALDEILKRDSRYDRDAYFFVRDGLDHTLKLRKKSAQGAERHVSGQELLEGIRSYALQQFGPLTRTVLEHWGVKRCEDFGEIVFNMVEKGVLSKTDNDTRDDFKGGYDFEEAFEKPFRPTRVNRPSARPPSANRLNPSSESPNRAQSQGGATESSKS